MSRQAISAEVFGVYNKKEEFKPKVVAKSPETKQQIKSLVEKIILFQSLNKEDINIVIDAMEEISVKEGETVIEEGSKGDTLYIIETGEYDCFKVIKGENLNVKSYAPGQFFGELALMYNAPRAATIIARTEGKLYGLDRSTFNHIVQEAASKKRKYYLDVLSKVEILSEIDPYEKEQLCDALKEEEFPAGTEVVHQGEEGTRFYIIAEGKVSAWKEEGGSEKKVFEYSEGDYFGEIALVKNTVRQASIRTDSDSRIVSIERDAFKRLLGPIEEILQRNMEKYKKYMAQ